MIELQPYLPLRHGVSRVLHRYADWRIGATEDEKHCHKASDTILLTFDDYGTATEVDEILTVLRRKQVKAMFFLQGSWASANPDLVKRIKRADHIIGNHTFSHPNLLSLPDIIVEREILQGLRAPWLRPPYGRFNSRIRRIAHKHGYAICYWTIDSRDWTGASLRDMRHTILSELKPGAVILFHIHGKNTRQLLPGLIDDIRQQGFELTSPNEIWQPARYL